MAKELVQSRSVSAINTNVNAPTETPVAATSGVGTGTLVDMKSPSPRRGGGTSGMTMAVPKPNRSANASAEPSSTIPGTLTLKHSPKNTKNDKEQTSARPDHSDGGDGDTARRKEGGGGGGEANGKGSMKRQNTGLAALERSLFLFEPNNACRQSLRHLVGSFYFDIFMVGVVTTNAILLALNRSDDSLTGDSPDFTDRLLYGLDLLFISVFTLEMCIKMIVFGVVFAGPRSYLRSSTWHQIEFVNVVLGLISLGVQNLIFIKILRFMWLIKSIGSIKGLRLMVISFIKSLSSLGLPAVLMLYLMFLFAIIFGQFYTGRLFYRCFDPNTHEVIPGTQVDGPLCNPFPSKTWGLQCNLQFGDVTNITTGQLSTQPYYCDHSAANPNYGVNSFDNILLSSLQILICWSGEGWTGIMYYVGESISKVNYFLFVLLMFAGYIFACHLITAVMFITFRQHKEEAAEADAKHNQTGTLANKQQNKNKHRWEDCTNHLLSRCGQCLDRSEERCCCDCFRSLSESCQTMVKHLAFERVMIVLITLNTVLLCMEYAGMDTVFRAVLDYIQYSFTGLFVLEMLIKHLAFGVRGYWKSDSNRFDGCVVLLTTVMSIVEYGNNAFGGFLMFRVLRFTETLGVWQSMRMLLKAIFSSFTDLWHFTLLTMLFIYVYAIMARDVLGGTMDFGEDQGGRVRWHFDTFGYSLVTVFQVMTPENWNQVLYDATRAIGWGGTIFILVLYLIGNYVVLNLFCALLLANFEDDHIEEMVERQKAAPPLSVNVKRCCEGVRTFWCCEPYEAEIAKMNGVLAKSRETSPRNKYSVNKNADTKDKKGDEDDDPGPVKLRLPNKPLNTDKPEALFKKSPRGRPDGEDKLSPSHPAANAVVELQAPRSVESSLNHPPAAPPQPQPLPQPTSTLQPEPQRRNSTITAVVNPKRPSTITVAPAAPSHPNAIDDEPSPIGGTASIGGGGARSTQQPPILRVATTAASQTQKLGSSDVALTRVSTMTNQSGYSPLNNRGFKKPGEILENPSPALTSTSPNMRRKSSVAGPPPINIIHHMSNHVRVGHILARLKDFLFAKKSGKDRRSSLALNPSQLSEAIPKEKAFGCLTADNPVRMVCWKIVKNHYFEFLVFVMILFSCVLLTLDEPGLDRSSKLAKFLDSANIGVAAFFALEMLLKIIAFGCVGHSGAYLNDRWNVMDFVVVIGSVASTAFGGSSSTVGTGIRTLRSIAALRALRLLSAFPEGRVTLECAVAAFYSTFEVLAFGVLLFVALGLIGVHYFGGRYYRCVDLQRNIYPYDEGECNAKDLVWRNPTDQGHFDNVASAVLVLFEISTQENWPSFMYTGEDATEPGKAPIKEHNAWAAVYFVVMILICSFFYAKLFVGAIVNAYRAHFQRHTGTGADTGDDNSETSTSNSGGGGEEMSPMQVQFIRVYRNIVSDRCRPAFTTDEPEPSAADACCYGGCGCGRNPCWLSFRMACFRLYKHRWFHPAVMWVLAINSLAMAMIYEGQSALFAQILSIIGFICSWVFIIEFVVKLSALGVITYFKHFWRIIEAVIAIGGLVDFLGFGLVAFNLNTPYYNPALFRALRTLRLVQVTDYSKGLRQLVQTLKYSLPGLYNITFLLIVVYFIWAIAGMKLFGTVQYGAFLNFRANFENFPIAMITLFRCTTGENWNTIMRDVMIRPPFCTDNVDCGSEAAGVLYFVSFSLLTTFLLLNIVVAIVMKHFEDEYQEGESLKASELPVTARQIRAFGKVWCTISHGQQTLSIQRLADLLKSVDGELGGFRNRDENVTAFEINQFIESLRLPTASGNPTDSRPSSPPEQSRRKRPASFPSTQRSPPRSQRRQWSGWWRCGCRKES